MSKKIEYHVYPLIIVDGIENQTERHQQGFHASAFSLHLGLWIRLLSALCNSVPKYLYWVSSRKMYLTLMLYFEAATTIMLKILGFLILYLSAFMT